MMDDTTLKAYRTLELEPQATLEEVKAAYKDLVKVWHPDRYQHESERLKRKAEEQLKQLTWAYERIAGTGAAAPAKDLVAMDFGIRWGFVDDRGATVIDAQFDEARAFSEGLAAVKVYDKWGFVNRAGLVQVNPLYEDCSDFSEGLAAVKWYGRWGYIDTTGTFVITPRFQEASPFKRGEAEVRLGARRGRLNRQGDVAFDPFSAGRHIG
jgi:hypothetical protein